jgi:co-chaperonin GroES (HSP10)
MQETFPRKPLLDRVIVREIPIAEYYEQPEGVDIDLDNAHIKERSDRGVVVAVSGKVDDVQVGDTVFFDEFALTDPVFLNPAHKLRHDLPLYWQMRVADLKGVAVEEEVYTQIDIGRGQGAIFTRPEPVHA